MGPELDRVDDHRAGRVEPEQFADCRRDLGLVDDLVRPTDLAVGGRYGTAPVEIPASERR